MLESITNDVVCNEIIYLFISVNCIEIRGSRLSIISTYSSLFVKLNLHFLPLTGRD